MKALFAGTFNPFTIGHLSIVERALGIFPTVAVAIGTNCNKSPDLSPQERFNAISRLFADNPRVEVYMYSGLTADFAKEINAGVLIRGVRGVNDFASEMDLADINREILGIETVFLPALPQLSFVSGSMVRELSSNGHDVSTLIPILQNNQSTNRH